MGRSSAARFAAWMPAIRAAPSTSPLWIAFDAIDAVVSGSMVTRHRAIALRGETSEGPTSRAKGAPMGSRCSWWRSGTAEV